mmetsp:Transcript_8098/g.17637  ORF Transcript_8098/g.17637 Transcript_8098/m.17637 type:complete len:243 (-) Transcript_8098:173-901(-)
MAAQAPSRPSELASMLRRRLRQRPLSTRSAARLRRLPRCRDQCQRLKQALGSPALRPVGCLAATASRAMLSRATASRATAFRATASRARARDSARDRDRVVPSASSGPGPPACRPWDSRAGMARAKLSQATLVVQPMVSPGKTAAAQPACLVALAWAAAGANGRAECLWGSGLDNAGASPRACGQGSRCRCPRAFRDRAPQRRRRKRGQPMWRTFNGTCSSFTRHLENLESSRARNGDFQTN